MSGNLEYIEKYLNGELSPAERNAFEEQMDTDEQFREEFRYYMISKQLIKREADRRLKDKLNLIGNKLDKEKEIKRTASLIRTVVRFAAAAILAGIIVAAAFLLIDSGKPSADQLISEYFVPASPGDLIQRGSSYEKSSGTIMWDSAFHSIANNQYQKAIPALEQLLSQDSIPTSPSLLQFLLGTCFFETGQYEKAVLTYSDIQPESGLYFGSQINKSLSLLKTGDITKAIQTLEKLLSNPAVPEKKPIRKLIRNLKNLQ